MNGSDRFDVLADDTRWNELSDQAMAADNVACEWEQKTDALWEALCDMQELLPFGRFRGIELLVNRLRLDAASKRAEATRIENAMIDRERELGLAEAAE